MILKYHQRPLLRKEALNILNLQFLIINNSSIAPLTFCNHNHIKQIKFILIIIIIIIIHKNS